MLSSAFWCLRYRVRTSSYVKTCDFLFLFFPRPSTQNSDDSRLVKIRTRGLGTRAGPRAGPRRQSGERYEGGKSTLERYADNGDPEETCAPRRSFRLRIARAQPSSLHRQRLVVYRGAVPDRHICTPQHHFLHYERHPIVGDVPVDPPPSIDSPAITLFQPFHIRPGKLVNDEYDSSEPDDAGIPKKASTSFKVAETTLRLKGGPDGVEWLPAGL